MSSAIPVVVRLEGELDIARRGELQRSLQAPNDARGVLLDLAEVTYADSTALAELLRFCIALDRKDVPVALLVMSPQFRRVIEYAGLTQALPVFAARESALAYLEEGRR